MPRALISAVSGFLPAAVAIASAARVGLSRLRTLIDEIRMGAEKAAKGRTESDLTGHVQALRAAEAGRELAESQLAAVEARVGELDRELAELEPGSGSTASWPIASRPATTHATSGSSPRSARISSASPR